MAQLTTVLPIDHLTGAEGGVTYSTTVYDGSTGLEIRNQNWPTGRHAWSLEFRGLLSEVQPVLDLFQSAAGMSKSFKFSPPGYVEGDFRFSSDEMKISYAATATPDEFITAVSVSVIQVLGE